MKTKKADNKGSSSESSKRTIKIACKFNQEEYKKLKALQKKLSKYSDITMSEVIRYAAIIAFVMEVENDDEPTNY